MHKVFLNHLQSIMSTSSTLTSQQRANANRDAKPILGSPAPLWSEMAKTTDKEAKLKLFLERLREPNNNSIANKLREKLFFGLHNPPRKGQVNAQGSKEEGAVGHPYVLTQYTKLIRLSNNVEYHLAVRRNFNPAFT